MKRHVFVWVILWVAFAGFSGGTQAQDKYPNRAIELVVPFAAGGGAVDVSTRGYSDNLAKLLKAPVTVVNRAGGTGIQGVHYVVNSKKDGYVLLSTSDSPLIVMPIISKEVSYDPLKDLIPIGHLGYSPSVLAVKSDSPFKTLAQLIEYARKNPGKLKNATSGFGTEAYLNLQILCNDEKIKITGIPFDGGAQASVAVLGGHTDMISSSTGSLSQHLKAGTMRGLAISSKKRHPDFPDIPTTAELGHPDANLVVWVALFAPAGVPKQVTDVLVPAVEKTFKDPEVIQRAIKAGLVVEYLGPKDMQKLVESGLGVMKKLSQSGELGK
jgi:tripartite-type tricarboxylate transporter receptor subunit TctC